MDDLFDTAATSNDAFEDLTDSKPADKFNKPKKENYWDKEDIAPTNIDVETLKRKGKSFAMYAFPENEVPDAVQAKFKALAKTLMENGYTFRHNASGDNELQMGIIKSPGAKFDSYLPWKKFNAIIKDPVLPTPVGYEIAITIHKVFMKLPPSVRAILASTVTTMLGEDATDPVDFILIWTADGSEAIKKGVDFKVMGNAVFPVQLAGKANIPVFNLHNEDAVERLKGIIK